MLTHMATSYVRSQIGHFQRWLPTRSVFRARRTTRTSAIGLFLMLTLHGSTAAGQEHRVAESDTLPASTEQNSHSPATRMQLPVTPPEQLTRAFDRPEHDWSAGHRGADFAGHPGDAVLAPAAGEVSYVGKVVDRGVLVLVHDNGLRSSFEPIESSLTPGQRVTAGSVLGRIAVESDGLGHCGPDCLHWGVRIGDRYLDPLQLVQGAPSVLIPEH